MPLHRFLGNKFLTTVLNYVLDWDLSEYHSGFRIYSCAALKNIPFDTCSDYYHFDTEILVQFKLKGLRVVERPIPTHSGSERSYVNVWRYGLDVLYVLVEYLLHRRGIRRVKKFGFD